MRGLQAYGAYGSALPQSYGAYGRRLAGFSRQLFAYGAYGSAFPQSYGAYGLRRLSGFAASRNLLAYGAYGSAFPQSYGAYGLRRLASFVPRNLLAYGAYGSAFPQSYGAYGRRLSSFSATRNLLAYGAYGSAFPQSYGAYGRRLTFWAAPRQLQSYGAYGSALPQSYGAYGLRRLSSWAARHLSAYGAYGQSEWRRLAGLRLPLCCTALGCLPFLAAPLERQPSSRIASQPACDGSDVCAVPPSPAARRLRRLRRIRRVNFDPASEPLEPGARRAQGEGGPWLRRALPVVDHHNTSPSVLSFINSQIYLPLCTSYPSCVLACMLSCVGRSSQNTHLQQSVVERTPFPHPLSSGPSAPLETPVSGAALPALPPAVRQ